MCFERLLQAFTRWQLGILFDTGAQPILEYRWIDSYSQPSLQTRFKVATVYSIHNQSLSWCPTRLVPNILPRRGEGSGEPCAVDHVFLIFPCRKWYRRKVRSTNQLFNLVTLTKSKQHWISKSLVHSNSIPCDIIGWHQKFHWADVEHLGTSWWESKRSHSQGYFNNWIHKTMESRGELVDYNLDL